MGVKETVAGIRKAGGKAVAMKHDVTSAPEWQNVVDRAVQEFGGIDVLVNNAGIYFIKSIGDTTEDQFDTMLDINVKGPWLGAKATLG